MPLFFLNWRRGSGGRRRRRTPDSSSAEQSKRRKGRKPTSSASTTPLLGRMSVSASTSDRRTSLESVGSPESKEETLKLHESGTEGSLLVPEDAQGVKDISRTIGLDEESPWTKTFREFCERTTLHGLPMVLRSSNFLVRLLWVIFCLSSLCLFVYQCVLVGTKYYKNEKIVSVELEFDSAHYPAITVCNLNPFKNHLARTVHEIRETLDAFHQAVTYSADAHSEEESRRKRRQLEGDFENNGGFRYVQYEPVISNCDCNRGPDHDCRQTDSIPESLEKSCICNFDRMDSSAWPCYDYGTWKAEECPGCNDIGFCNLPNTTVGEESLRPCMCNLNNGYCLMKSEKRLRRIWEFRGKAIPKKGSPFRADFLKQLKALGYENMTDQVAITTQTMERLILKMAALPVERRIALSYGKSELIKMCSFNGMQCDIEKDFKLHIDHTFGNCYTFNANPKRMFVSSRAGPSYGLRLMVFVNASDYLPTTDAVGVRIAIHGQKESPFPDTFGYSAPTGVVSSFGLSLRKLNRLNEGMGGACVPPEAPLPANYIYKKYEYEPEGCYKSCYQSRIISRCGCYDPRLPSTDNKRWKPCLDQKQTTCLLDEAVKLTKRSNLCTCKQPCQQDVYTTTYSAAKWPSGSVNMACDSGKDCIKYYREHAAMLEIYYEQMSYEIIRESQSYQFVNVLSDIGGQAGLWLGASILTVVELFSLIAKMFRIALSKCERKRKYSVDPHGDKKDEDINKNYQSLGPV